MGLKYGVKKMSSAEHQIQLNALAKALEERGIKITHVDVDGKPEHFDYRYRTLSTPDEMDDSIPDLIGTKDGVLHIGESKTEIRGDANIDAQFRTFSNRIMSSTRQPIPFHIIIPKHLDRAVNDKLTELGLSDKKQSGQIRIWTYEE